MTRLSWIGSRWTISWNIAWPLKGSMYWLARNIGLLVLVDIQHQMEHCLILIQMYRIMWNIESQSIDEWN